MNLRNLLYLIADANPLRYCSEYYDAESGDYYLRARYYAPGLGRFLSEDPLRDGDNWYVYCNNNPVRYVDPSGKIAVVDDIYYAVILVTGVIAIAEAVWLTSPEGQQALNNGAKVIHEAVKNVEEAIDNARESIVNPSGGGAPAPQKPNNNGPTAIKIISKIATGAALKEAAEEIFKAGSGRSNNKIDFPDGDAQLKHILEMQKDIFSICPKTGKRFWMLQVMQIIISDRMLEEMIGMLLYQKMALKHGLE